MNLEPTDAAAVANSIDLDNDKLWKDSIDPHLLDLSNCSSISNTSSPFPSDRDSFADLFNPTTTEPLPNSRPSSSYRPLSEPPNHLNLPFGTSLQPAMVRAHSQPPPGEIMFTRSNGTPISVDPVLRHPFPSVIREPRRGRQAGAQRDHPYRRAEASKAPARRRERATGPGLMVMEEGSGGLAGDGVAENLRSQRLLRALDAFLAELITFRGALLAEVEGGAGGF